MVSFQRVRSAAGSVLDLYATPLRVSHYVELVNPLWISHRLQARVEDVRDETADARTITLRPGRNWRRHRAGQHVRIGVPIDGERYTRTYSISSTPERRDGCITITVKVLDGGRMSGHLVRRLRVGAHLPIGLPQGDFVVPEARPVRPLFITAGSGITPVMSMLRTWATVGNMPDVCHVHYAPHAYDVIFGTELRQIEREHPRYRPQLVLTRELAGTSRDHHFSAAQLTELCPDWATRDAWACGPQQLLDDVEAHYATAGRSAQVHTERFRAAFVEADPNATGGAVTFLANGDRVVTTGDASTPLLRVAEDAGLNPAHGCRMGICHTCDVPLVSGSVRDLRTGTTINEPGHPVQICTASAAGDCVIQLTNQD